MSQQNKVEQLVWQGKDAGFETRKDKDIVTTTFVNYKPNLSPNKSESGSLKNDSDKFDPTMLTIELVELLSRVRMFGAKKYARNNFKITGFKYTRSLAAALRHIFQFLNGEDNDPESNLSHLGHAVASLEHCIYDSVHHPNNDDRKGP